MSNLFRRILGNISTRIMLIIYITIILVTGFFIIFGYYNQLSLQEERQYDKLKAIVTSVAVNINGDAFNGMMTAYPEKDGIASVGQDSVYDDINWKLSQAVALNHLNSAMYTLVYVPEKDVFNYGVRSDSQVYYRHEYQQYPPVLKEKMSEGGTIPSYQSENGVWLSAFHPIKNSKGDVVGLLEADTEFSAFMDEVRLQYMKQALIALGVIVVIAFLLIPYTRKILKEDERQKKLFMEQKLLIEESHREIKDSISYAKRIQTAILPPNRIVKESLKESFILYKPKDIVAGDFYWMEHRDNVVLFAACDCTGHGVPGAMVSVICNNALNRSVREYGLTDPGKILDKTREIVIQEFEKSDDEVKDGMDVSICAYSISTNTLYWAGANNPFWLLRNGATEMEEVKPNKQPIGKFSDQKPFTTHSFQMTSGDSFYIFTDGYQDQFGGEKGKKFKAAALKELLVSIKDKPMDQQRLVIDDAFEKWRGKLEQVDDVCVIGVRI
jgi:serine phosphatase RsbU (regulator of sigma subunit)